MGLFCIPSKAIKDMTAIDYVECAEANLRLWREHPRCDYLLSIASGMLGDAIRLATGATEKKPREPAADPYTCKGKGGTYELVGEASGAGQMRGQNITVYRCTDSGRLFVRTNDDFAERMERVPVAPKIVKDLSAGGYSASARDRMQLMIIGDLLEDLHHEYDSGLEADYTTPLTDKVNSLVKAARQAGVTYENGMFLVSAPLASAISLNNDPAFGVKIPFGDREGD